MCCAVIGGVGNMSESTCQLYGRRNQTLSVTWSLPTFTLWDFYVNLEWSNLTLIFWLILQQQVFTDDHGISVSCLSCSTNLIIIIILTLDKYIPKKVLKLIEMWKWVWYSVHTVSSGKLLCSRTAPKCCTITEVCQDRNYDCLALPWMWTIILMSYYLYFLFYFIFYPQVVEITGLQAKLKTDQWSGYMSGSSERAKKLSP